MTTAWRCAYAVVWGAASSCHAALDTLSQLHKNQEHMRLCFPCRRGHAPTSSHTTRVCLLPCSMLLLPRHTQQQVPARLKLVRWMHWSTLNTRMTPATLATAAAELLSSNYKACAPTGASRLPQLSQQQAAALLPYPNVPNKTCETQQQLVRRNSNAAESQQLAVSHPPVRSQQCAVAPMRRHTSTRTPHKHTAPTRPCIYKPVACRHMPSHLGHPIRRCCIQHPRNSNPPA
jgi:hypothetical protein